jgi:hypothetical protein
MLRPGAIARTAAARNMKQPRVGCTKSPTRSPIEAISPAELVAKFDVLRDAIPFKGMRWDDLRAYRLVASIRKDAERLIA